MNNKIKIDFDGAAFGSMILIFIGLMFIMPFINFALCYFAGWIAKVLIGKWLVAGFALLRLPIEINDIPLIAGVLGWISSFFKNSTVNKNSNN